MMKFFASVQRVQEAECALRGGVDAIDVTVAGEDGVLGLIRDVVATVGGRKPVSASIVCPMDEGKLRAMVERYAASGVDWLMAVLYADQELDFAFLPLLAECGFRGVMLDTSPEREEGLLHFMQYDQLARFIGQAKALKLEAGLAGSLEAPDVPRLLPLQPDVLVFGRGLFGADGGFDPGIIDEVRALIPAADYNAAVADASSAGIDFGTDKIFVREFVLPVEIGAYSFERGKAQKVQFDVVAEVQRLTHDPQDMRHVVSYDVIMDGIRAIVARGHVTLAEALAEQVANHVLADRRVLRVMVRVEKLEIAPGRVGVEIERTRAGYDAIS